MPYLYWTIFENTEKHSPTNWLSPTERLQLKAFSSECRMRNWLAGRLAAKTLISRYLREREIFSPELADIKIAYAAGGEPQAHVEGRILSDISLSIAHSHNHGFSGLTELNEEGRIGVDIERIRPVNEKLARRTLSSEELQAIRATFRDREQEGLILYWTLKEAALKALKPMIAVSMKQLEVQMEVSQGQAKIHLPSSAITLEAHYQREGVFFRTYALAPVDLKNLI